ncbi:uncharacterized protein LOC102163231 isoform X2 [Sus scrofa]|uniref:uncharacterized protein LOC102163231 isoform X2 n=1 Tax=Sus scrofa TaxID=9823 RepID=UPI000A2B49D9|nr:uncharacterized protein LOC102163231 isoform X2 [Sus scrofa]
MRCSELPCGEARGRHVWATAAPHPRRVLPAARWTPPPPTAFPPNRSPVDALPHLAQSLRGSVCCLQLPRFVITCCAEMENKHPSRRNSRASRAWPLASGRCRDPLKVLQRRQRSSRGPRGALRPPSGPGGGRSRSLTSERRRPRPHAALAPTCRPAAESRLRGRAAPAFPGSRRGSAASLPRPLPSSLSGSSPEPLLSRSRLAAPALDPQSLKCGSRHGDELQTDFMESLPGLLFVFMPPV